MKPHPFLLGAALLFWGWQTGFLIPGVVMAVVMESPVIIKGRWEFSDDDFRRLWTFCSLLLLAALVYAFTDNRGPADFLGLFENPNYFTQRNAGTASAKTAAALLRWLPMIFFLFVAAQAFSAREGIPLETMSVILGIRWKKAKKSGRPLPPGRSVNVGYPYFAICLFAASTHGGENNTFFWAVAALLAWALWPFRARRFGVGAWACALGAAIVLGYGGQRGVGRLQHLLENYNPQWFSRGAGGRGDAKQTRTAIGHIGQLKMSAKIVIRLQTEKNQPVPTLLREASYRQYRSQERLQEWRAGSSKEDFVEVASEIPNGLSYVLVPDKTNRAAVNIACLLRGGRGLVPLPEGSGRLDLELEVIRLEKNSAGALSAFGPGLIMLDAKYGPGPSMDSPPTAEDLSLPDHEVPILSQVISELGLRNSPRDQAVRALGEYFRTFNYSSWQGPPPPTETNTPLGHFLLSTHSGHCEYFATATTLLLRQLKIPARYAVGYAVHEASGEKYVVRQRDAHAWCIVWNEAKAVWDDLDTTPASWVEAEEKRASPFQLLADAWNRLVFEIAKLRYGQTHLRQYILLALVPVLLLLLYQILFRRRKRKGGRTAAPAPARIWPGLDSEFYELERKLVRSGFARQDGEPLTAWLARALRNPACSGLQAPLQNLLRLHYRFRFDPEGLNNSDREDLRRKARECLTLLESRAHLTG
jgi:hypothetical protein